MQKNSDEDAPRLSRLEADLRPSNLIEQVRAIVLSNGAIDLILELGDSDEGEVSEFQNFERTCHELGSAVANDDTVFSVLLTDVIHGGSGAWAFGRGLAGTTPDRRKLWEKIVAEFESIEPAHRSLQVLRGILAETWELERDLAQSLLDSALDSLALRVDFPWLQSAVGLDQRGVARLSNALREGLTSVLGYRNLALGQVMKDAPSGALKDLLLLISEQPDGFDVAREILVTCIAQSRLAQQALAPEILEAGQLLLRRITFAKSGAHDTYELAEIVKACVAAPQTASVAAEIVGHLKEAVGAYEAHAFQYAELLAALLEAHPEVVLDVLCSGSEVDRQVGVRAFENHSQNFRNPSNVISCETLISWCNADRDLRYPFAAAIVTFSSNQKDGKPEIWSEQARALISNAPEPKSVLTAFVERFPPNSWMGSRASIMEGRAALLDDLPMDTLPDLLSFLRETKLKFLELVAQERKWETQRDRAMDERFE